MPSTWGVGVYHPIECQGGGEPITVVAFASGVPDMVTDLLEVFWMRTVNLKTVGTVVSKIWS